MHGGAGDQKKITMGGQAALMSAKEFAETAFGAVAVNGVTHRGSGGDHAGARADAERSGWVGEPPNCESAGVKATALSSDSSNFVLAAEVLLRAKTHGLRQ